MPVIPQEGGPYSLFCTNCKTWVPNTANAEMRKEGCFAHSHTCGHLQSNEIPDDVWQRQQQEKEAHRVMKIQNRNEAIYREIAHRYHTEDAMRQVKDYLEAHAVDPENFDGSFDFNYLATVFEENHDCNIADNDQWQAIIEEYIKANDIDLTKQSNEYFVSIAVNGRFSVHIKAATKEAAIKKANFACQEANFGELSDIEWKVDHLEDEDGTYIYPNQSN